MFIFILFLKVLDYLPVESVEKVSIYDSSYSAIGPNTKSKWEIEKDLIDFPVVTNGNFVTIKLSLRGQMSGRLAFVFVLQGEELGIKVIVFLIKRETSYSLIYCYSCSYRI